MRGRTGTGAGDLRVEHVLVAPPAKKFEISHHGVRQYVEKWMRRVSRSGACYLGRNRKNTKAAERNSGEEIRQPRGTIRRGGRGEMDRGPRALSRRRRRVIWGIKAPGINSGENGQREQFTCVILVSSLKTMMTSSPTSSIFFISYFSFVTFDLGLQIKPNKSIKICKNQNSYFKYFGTFSNLFQNLEILNNA